MKARLFLLVLIVGTIVVLGTSVASSQERGVQAEGQARSIPAQVDPGTRQAHPAADARWLATASITTPLPLGVVGSVGGDQYTWHVEAVTVQGNYAYVGAGSRLVILDVTEPTTPTLVGQSAEVTGTIGAIAVDGTYAYVLAEQVHVFDISLPMSPTLVGSCTTSVYPNLPRSVAITGTFLYVVSGYDLRVINVTDPTAPTEIGFLDLPGYDVAVVGNHAYVANYDGLHIVDLTSPAAPTEVGYLQTRGELWSVEVVGNYAYLAGTTIAGAGGGLYIVDITDPAAPRQVSYYADLQFGWPLAVGGSYAYASTGIFDISHPTSPTKVPTWSLRPPLWAIALGDRHAYVANGDWGLRVIDVNLPYAPQEVALLGLKYDFHSVVVSDTYAYVANGELGFSLIDISTLETPTVVTTTTPCFDNEMAAVSGNYACVPCRGWDRLAILDVSNPLAPIDVSPPRIYHSISGVAVQGNRAYVLSDTGFGEWALQALDVTDPFTITNTCILNKSPHQVVVEGDYAYLFDGEGTNVGVTVVDVSDPLTLTQSGYYESPNDAYDVAVAGDLLYVVDGGLHVVDVTTPTMPVEVGVYTPTAAVYTRIAVQGDYAWVLDNVDGLYLFDVSQPASPSPLGFYPFSQGRDVVMDGNLIYLVRRDTFEILQWQPPSTAIVDASGGTLLSSFDAVTYTYTFAAGVFTDTVVVTHIPWLSDSGPSTDGLVRVGPMFEVQAVYSGTGQPAQLVAGQTFTLAVQYEDAKRYAEGGTALESTLALYYQDGNQWVQETGTVDTDNNVVIARPNHFSVWALMGDTLHLSKTVTPTAGLSNGDVLTYTLTLSGTRSGPPLNIQLVDPLPASLHYVSETLTNTLAPPAVYSPTIHAIIWEGALLSQTVQELRFQATLEITRSSWPLLPVVNTAWITETTEATGISAAAAAAIKEWRVHLPLIARSVLPRTCEEILTKQQVWQGNLSWTCDESIRRAGAFSLRLQTFIPSIAEAYSYLIPVRPNQTYGVSYWVKTNLEVDGAELYGRVVAAQYNTQSQEDDEINENRLDSGFGLGRNATLHQDWTFESYVFTTGPETAYIRLRALIGGPVGTARGEIWLDQVTVSAQ
jgi:uncharacterized repeat protein (TIGR01451 family)